MDRAVSVSQVVRAVDRWTAIAAASILVGINQLIVNVQPLLLGALARHDGLSDTQLGLISSALIGGASIASATGPAWVRSVNWRTATAVFIAGAALALAAATRSEQFGILCAIFFMMGTMKGGIGVPSFVCLGDSANPERNFGTSVAIQASMAALAAVPMAAYLIPAFGPNGVYYSLIGALLFGIAALPFLPPGGEVRTTKKDRQRIILTPELLPFLAMMIAMILFTVGVTGFWFFLERIGTAKHIPESTIGIAVSGTALISIPGSFCVTWLSRWLSGLRFVLLGSLLILLGYGLIALPSARTFLSGSLIFAFGWGVAQPGYWALASQTDTTARLFALSPAAAGIASVIAGLVSGPVIVASGYDGLMAFAASAIAAGMLLALLAMLKRR